MECEWKECTPLVILTFPTWSTTLSFVREEFWNGKHFQWKVCTAVSPLGGKTPRRASWATWDSSKKYIFVLLSCWDCVVRAFGVFIRTNKLPSQDFLAVSFSITSNSTCINLNTRNVHSSTLCLIDFSSFSSYHLKSAIYIVTPGTVKIRIFLSCNSLKFYCIYLFIYSFIYLFIVHWNRKL